LLRVVQRFVFFSYHTELTADKENVSTKLRKGVKIINSPNGGFP